MKKIISAVLLFVLGASSLFTYVLPEDFSDMLVDDNQLAVRLERVGVLAGNNNIRFMAGFTSALNDVIIDNITTGSKGQGINVFNPGAIAGVGYKTDMFGVALGYQFKWISSDYQVHTPIVALTAMDGSLRLTVPVFVGIGSGDSKGLTVVSTAMQLRYYTGMEVFSQLRLYARYGSAMAKDQDNKNYYEKSESFGIQLRGYFGAMVGDILVEPILRVQYDMALKSTIKDVLGTHKNIAGDNLDITAEEYEGGRVFGDLTGGFFADEIAGAQMLDPYRFGIAIPVGFTANSDIVSLYLEPALSFTMLGGRNITLSDGRSRKDPFYTFGYVVYGEIYITPLPALEWYFECQTGGATVADGLAGENSTSLVFNASTGITWYF